MPFLKNPFTHAKHIDVKVFVNIEVRTIVFAYPDNLAINLKPKSNNLKMPKGGRGFSSFALVRHHSVHIGCEQVKKEE